MVTAAPVVGLIDNYLSDEADGIRDCLRVGCLGPDAKGDRVMLCDAEIRPALRAALFARYADQPDTIIAEELGVCRGRVRIDMAVVNGVLHGYEIKSDRDSLRRLNIQVDYYGRVLDRATLVAGDRHLADAIDLVPDWWGILRVQQTPRQPQFETIRRGRKNPTPDPRSLVEFLWLRDALALLETREAAKGARGRPRQFVWDRICDHFSVDEIASAVRAQIKARAVTQAPA